MRTIADHIYDIAYNSIKAEADNIILKIEYSTAKNTIIFSVRDDGNGIPDDKMDSIFDPFFTTRDSRIRKVGLGLPLLKQNAESAGGYVKIESKENQGTYIEVMFKTDDIDIPELGELASTLVGLLTFKEGVNWTMELSKDAKVETISTAEIKEILGDDVPLGMPQVIEVLNDMAKTVVDELDFSY